MYRKFNFTDPEYEINFVHFQVPMTLKSATPPPKKNNKEKKPKKKT